MKQFNLEEYLINPNLWLRQLVEQSMIQKKKQKLRVKEIKKYIATVKIEWEE